jgi:hypothetical protein
MMKKMKRKENTLLFSAEINAILKRYHAKEFQIISKETIEIPTTCVADINFLIIPSNYKNEKNKINKNIVGKSGQV